MTTQRFSISDTTRLKARERRHIFRIVQGEVPVTTQPLTDLYDNNQEKGHVSCEVDLVDLEHGGTQAEDQGSYDNLDGLENRGAEHRWAHY